jgi:hypothetical protein
VGVGGPEAEPDTEDREGPLVDLVAAVPLEGSRVGVEEEDDNVRRGA